MAVNPKPLTENDIRTIQVWIGTDSHLKKTLLKADVLSALAGLKEEIQQDIKDVEADLKKDETNERDNGFLSANQNALRYIDKWFQLKKVVVP